MSKDKWTLVTGASGFIGSRLVRALVDRGEHVKAFVRAGSDLTDLRGLPEDRFQLAFGDTMVEHTVYRALNGCNRLYHLAANFSFGPKRAASVIDPAVLGTEATLTAAQKRNIEKVVFTSSAFCLGATHEPEPMDEEHEFNVDDVEPYVEAKVQSEEVALEIADDGLPLVAVLPGSVFGPRDRRPTPTGRALLQYLGMSPNLRVPVTACGFNVVDVDDVVQGHILAMERGEPGERYILGGEDLTLTAFYETLSDLTGLALPGKELSPGVGSFVAWLIELKARWDGEPPLITRKMAERFGTRYVFLSSAKAERELGYRARPARDALERAVRWYLDNGYVSESAAQRVRLELRAA